MKRVKLGDVAIEHKETCKGNKDDFHSVGLEHLIPGEVKLSTWDTNSDNTFTKRFNKGQILLGRRRAYLKKAVIAPFDGICSGDITVIGAIDGKVSENLLPFIIQNDKFFDYAVKGSAGSLSPRVKWEYLKNYEFELPAIEEQERLAELLWAAYDMKESYKNLIAATDEMVKSQFIEMFDTISIPDIQIGSAFKTVSGGTPDTKNQHYYNDGNIPWLNSSEVSQGYIKDTAIKITQQGVDNSSAKIVPINSVVVAMYGATVGKVGLLGIEAATNQAICSILPNDYFMPEYLYHAMLFQKDYMISNARGAAQPNISQSFIRNMKIKQPSIELQNTFVSIVNQADKSKAELQQSIDNINNVMKSLLP